MTSAGEEGVHKGVPRESGLYRPGGVTQWIVFKHWTPVGLTNYFFFNLVIPWVVEPFLELIQKFSDTEMGMEVV